MRKHEEKLKLRPPPRLPLLRRSRHRPPRSLAVAPPGGRQLQPASCSPRCSWHPAAGCRPRLLPPQQLAVVPDGRLGCGDAVAGGSAAAVPAPAGGQRRRRRAVWACHNEQNRTGMRRADSEPRDSRPMAQMLVAGGGLKRIDAVVHCKA